jgi:hypothetical protein
VLEDNIATVVPEHIKSLLFSEAVRRFGSDIVPVLTERTLNTCYRCNGGKYQFWFNTKKDNSTHLVSCAVNLNI